MTKPLRHLLLCLLTAMVLAQTVGVLHRVVHAKREGEGVASPSVHAVVATHASSLWGLWGDHSTPSDCQQFDQSCPDLLLDTAWALPVQAWPALWWVALLHERFALFERFYAARGPPAVLL